MRRIRRWGAPPPIPRAPAESDEERIRKFLEALGQPTTSKPPPPVMPRPTYQQPMVLPHVPPFASPLPPLTTRPPALPRRVAIPKEIIKPPYEKKVFRPKVAETPAFELQEKPTVSETSPPVIKTPAEAYAIVS